MGQAHWVNHLGLWCLRVLAGRVLSLPSCSSVEGASDVDLGTFTSGTSAFESDWVGGISGEDAFSFLLLFRGPGDGLSGAGAFRFLLLFRGPGGGPDGELVTLVPWICA
jgi:hypothetical protein